MKAITVRQPWAHLIATGAKRIENRPWQPAYRGPLAIHAAKCTEPPPDDVMDALERRGITIPFGAEMTYGAIVAVVNLVDCVALADLSEELAADPFAVGPWCWILADARAVTPPIPCKGKLGLWESPAS